MAAFPLIVLYLGNERWFYQDEWDFLVTREATSVHDLIRPHNEHWSTLPVLVYRGLYSIFGLRTYLPYQAVVVVLHLTAVLLLWLVLRRCGVSAWVSAVTAASLILFGAGKADIVRAFNMSLGLPRTTVAWYSYSTGRAIGAANYVTSYCRVT